MDIMSVVWYTLALGGFKIPKGVAESKSQIPRQRDLAGGENWGVMS